MYLIANNTIEWSTNKSKKNIAFLIAEGIIKRVFHVNKLTKAGPLYAVVGEKCGDILAARGRRDETMG